MAVRFPAPLEPGDRVGVTAPSSGVPDDFRARLDVAVKAVEARGYQADPQVDTFTLDGAGSWTLLTGGSDVVVEGRLIGGCIETLSNVAGTPYGDVASFARRYAPDGLLVYVEAAGDDAFAICRNLHGLRLAGFFTAANAVLVGRTRAPATDSLTQHEAVLDALGSLGVPIIADVECGHVPPYLPIVNGAHGRLVCGTDQATLVQTLA